MNPNEGKAVLSPNQINFSQIIFYIPYMTQKKKQKKADRKKNIKSIKTAA